jgi:hypothetical protein
MGVIRGRVLFAHDPNQTGQESRQDKVVLDYHH